MIRSEGQTAATLALACIQGRHDYCESTFPRPTDRTPKQRKEFNLS